MADKRALLYKGLFVLSVLAVVALVHCRHGFSLREGGVGRLGFFESSGLVKSRTHEGTYWTHADSAAPPVIIAIDGQGRTLGEFRLDGVENRDWEDIAVDDQGSLYIGDIGNNANTRKDLVVYRVREPETMVRTGTVEVEAKIHFRFPDQLEFPPGSLDFDAESLFWHAGRLYLLTKHRSNNHTKLYRFPSLDGRTEVILERISEFDLGVRHSRFGGMVTAADIRPQGDFLAVLSYDAVFLFRTPEEGDDFLSTLHKRIDLDFLTVKQCEAIAWDGDALVITNETAASSVLTRPSMLVSPSSRANDSESRAGEIDCG